MSWQCQEWNYSFNASTGMTMVTSSPTRGAYLPALNSERLTMAVALAPTASFFSIGCVMCWKEVTVSVTGLVTPLIVRLPSRAAGLPPADLTAVDLKVATR